MRAGIGAIGRRWASATAEREHGAVSQDIGRLLITCPDRPGIVAAVSRFLYERGADILESQQYSTNPFGGTFFLLIEFHLPGLAGQTCELEEDFAALSDEFSMHWKMTRAAVGKRAAVFVSKADHALQELLWRVNSGELNADIVMVISNHEDLADVVAGWGIPFHHVPVSAETKPDAEAVQLSCSAAMTWTSSCSHATCRSSHRASSPSSRARSSTSITVSCLRSWAPTLTRRPPSGV